MNAENFTDYLESLANLYQVPYEELKHLVLQYPYCANLQFLLAQKSRLQDHKDLNRDIARAALYGIDRTRLYERLKHIEPIQQEASGSVLPHEEYLELKDLKDLQQERAALELQLQQLQRSVPERREQALPEIEFQTQSNGVQHPELDLSGTTVDDQMPEQTTSAANDSSAEQQSIPPDPDTRYRWVQELSDLLPILQERIEYWRQQQDVSAHKKTPSPRPKSSFPSWVQQFQPDHLHTHLDQIMETKRKGKKKKRSQRENLAPILQQVEQSIQDNDSMASQTLAELLEAQMQYEQAIQVYERLRLNFPEKNAYFTGQIKKLKNLIP